MPPLQFVWWGWADAAGRWFRFFKFQGSAASFYKWSYNIGPLEVRRWNWK